jgi:hypothetical protein
MSRARGGYIGFNRVPAASALNSAASGVWSLREAEALRRAGTWPTLAPGGVSTGLQLWLDASDASTLYDATSGGSLVAADGGVARWEDKSGNGRHATQGTASRRPVRKAAIQGGKDVLRFDGSATAGDADRMQITNSTSMFNFLHQSSGTVFCVLINGTTNDYNRVMVWLDSGGVGAATGYLFAYADRAAQGENNMLASGGGASVNAYYTTANNYVDMQVAKVYTNVVNATASAASRSLLYKNGSLNAAVNSATGSNANNATYNMMIGGGGDNTGTLPFQGDILEMIIYDSALSSTDRAAVETYLLAKWGIT